MPAQCALCTGVPGLRPPGTGQREPSRHRRDLSRCDRPPIWRYRARISLRVILNLVAALTVTASVRAAPCRDRRKPLASLRSIGRRRDAAGGGRGMARFGYPGRQPGVRAVAVHHHHRQPVVVGIHRRQADAPQVDDGAPVLAAETTAAGRERPAPLPVWPPSLTAAAVSLSSLDSRAGVPLSSATACLHDGHTLRCASNSRRWAGDSDPTTDINRPARRPAGRFTRASECVARRQSPPRCAPSVQRASRRR